MDLAEYQTLTGITVPANQQASVEAQIARTQLILETLLGFTLTPDDVDENLYNELGKTQQECFCPSVDIDEDSLQPADPVVGAYRLYSYNPKDTFFHVDPFSEIHKVKLVKDNVTIKTFDAEQYRVQVGQGGLSKFIEHCKTCLCQCYCMDCIQLAVDADWLWEDDIPQDLLYVWADMVTYYANCKRFIKSETLDNHSYTKFDNKNKNGNPMLPEEEAANLAVIRKYAGPYGSVVRNVTV